MIYRVSEKEINKIKLAAEHLLPVMIVAAQRNIDFDVGDVIVKEKFESGAWQPELMPNSEHVPKKYRVVYKDEYEVCWVKQISVRKGLGKALKCTLDINYKTERWKLDPEQLNSIILGEKYDPREQYRTFKEQTKQTPKSDGDS